ncbi:MAG: hypothetical protein AAF609_11205 [Cyanobacteria bacterium P01_C01_bin.120]
MDQHLRELLSSSVYRHPTYYRSRAQLLTLPSMVTAVVALLWHQVPSVAELTRMRNRPDLQRSKALAVSRQAISERFLSFPHQLFEGVFEELVRLKAQMSVVVPIVKS